MELTEEDLYSGFDLPAPEPEEPEGPETQPEGGEPPSEEQEPGAEPPTADGEGGESGEQEPPPAAPPAPRAETGQGPDPGDLDAAYARAFAGKLNPYTNQPIRSRADYEAYQQAFRAEQRAAAMQRIREAGIEPELLGRLIEDHPAVQEAKAAAQQMREQQERAQEAEAMSWYQEQTRAITALDPEIRSLEDLERKHPEQMEQLFGMVSKGVDLVSAYKALNFDALMEKRSAAARQAVRNQVEGKSHLEPVGGRSGGGSVEVPGDIRAMYESMGIELSEDELRREYGAYLKEARRAGV